jgi:hypothetical protein
VAEKLIKRTDLTGGVSFVTLAKEYSEKCPEVWIEVDTIYVKGKVVALVMNSPFAELIIGNSTRVGIPAEKDGNNKKLKSEEDTCQAVETRSSTKRKSIEKEVLDVDQGFDENYSRDEWIEEQRNDTTLEVYRKQASDSIPKDGSGFISLDKGMLYRHFRSDQTQIQR